MACLRFDPSPGLLCSGRRAIQLSTLTRTNSHQVHARLAFLIVKERNHSVQPCPRPKSPSLLAWPRLNAALAIDSADTGGAGRDRTDGLLLAKQALSQLSYGPAGWSRRSACSLVPDLCDTSNWWVWMDSNHRPPPYQDGALTN